MKEKVTLGVLAGGKSSRMGQNKALMDLGGMTMLEHAVSLGQGFAETLVSVDTPERYAGQAFSFAGKARFVYDEQEAFGPLEGIYQLVKAAKTPYVLAVATDLPFLTEEFLQKWADRADGSADIYVLTIEGDHPEPLCSVYGKGALPAFEELRANDLHRPRMLFDKVKTVYVDISELGFDKNVMNNVNTPEEYAHYVLKQ